MSLSWQYDIWFSSDQHFSHKNVIKYSNRPFRTWNPFIRLWEWWTGKISEASVKKMDAALIKRWNAKVKRQDIVFVLGDFSLGMGAVERYSHKLNGNLFLVPGNHDQCHPSHRKGRTPEKRANQEQKYLNAGWYNILPIKDQKIFHFNKEGKTLKVNLCHMPYKGDTTDDRFQDFRMEDDGTILLCGHVHDAWQYKLTTKNTLMINVGVEQWNYAPVNLREILQLVEDLNGIP